MPSIRLKSGSSSSWGSTPPSEARLRAQRANAQLATGPKTREGRRRSALNRLAAKPKELKLMWGGVEPHGHREFLRIWRDLRFLFWFVKRDHWRWEPRLEIYLREAARAWQSKLEMARNGFSAENYDVDIESRLADFMFEYRLLNHKWDCWCRREFVASGREVRKLREGIEARMSAFHRRQRKGIPTGMKARQQRPSMSPTEATPGKRRRTKGAPTITSLDPNQFPITHEDFGLGPYEPPFGLEFTGNRNQWR